MSCPDPDTNVKFTIFRPTAICCYGNIAILMFLSLYFFIVPFCIITYYLADTDLNGEGIPQIAFWSHRSLSPKYEKWAQERVASGQAK